MRLLLTLSAASMILLPTTTFGQTTAYATGEGARATVRTAVGLSIPAMFRVVAVGAPEATWQGENYTEYLITYTVAANTRWQFAADALPHGVTLLVLGGEWRGAKDSDLVVQRGAVSNGTEVRVRVRVADGASINWRNELRFRATSANAVTAAHVAAD